MEIAEARKNCQQYLHNYSSPFSVYFCTDWIIENATVGLSYMSEWIDEAIIM